MHGLDDEENGVAEANNEDHDMKEDGEKVNGLNGVKHENGVKVAKLVDNENHNDECENENGTKVKQEVPMNQIKSQ